MNDTAGTFNTHSLASRLGVSEKTVRKWDARRLIPGRLTLGRAVRYDRLTVEKRLLSGALLLDVEARGST